MSETYKPKIWSPTESSKLSFKVESAQVENTSDEDPVASTAFFKTGIVTSAAGSAYYECGATKVVCAVYGPMPCVKTQSFDRGTLVCEFSFAPFATAPREDGKARRRGRTDPEESLCASMLHDALSVAVLLTKYPKHEVQVHVQVLERGGGELAAAINAASAALADSGIEMYGLAAASTAAYISGRGAVSHPSSADLAHPKCRGSLTLASLPALHQVTFAHQSGSLTVAQADLLVAAATADAATAVEAAAARLTSLATVTKRVQDAAAAAAGTLAAAVTNS